MTARDMGRGEDAREMLSWLDMSIERLRGRQDLTEANLRNKYLRLRTLLAAPVSAPGMDREAVARIVDPDGWATFDRQRATLTNMGRDPETELGPWMYVKRSLAKADQIIALQRDAEPADGSQVEPSTTGAGRQIIPTDDQGGEGT